MLIQNKYGKCSYSFEKDNIGSYVHIYNLFVKPYYRRRGKARELINLAISSIRENGYTGPIQIVAQPKNCSISKAKLIEFYKSMNLEVFECYI